MLDRRIAVDSLLDHIESHDLQNRIYCHTSWETGTCQHVPPHPFVVPGSFESIRAANDRGGEIVAKIKEENIEWEIIDENGELVC